MVYNVTRECAIELAKRVNAHLPRLGVELSLGTHDVETSNKWGQKSIVPYTYWLGRVGKEFFVRVCPHVALGVNHYPLVRLA